MYVKILSTSKTTSVNWRGDVVFDSHCIDIISNQLLYSFVFTWGLYSNELCNSYKIDYEKVRS